MYIQMIIVYSLRLMSVRSLWSKLNTNPKSDKTHCKQSQC